MLICDFPIVWCENKKWSLIGQVSKGEFGATRFSKMERKLWLAKQWKGMFGFEQPFLWVEQCVTSQETAAKETMSVGKLEDIFLFNRVMYNVAQQILSWFAMETRVIQFFLWIADERCESELSRIHFCSKQMANNNPESLTRFTTLLICCFFKQMTCFQNNWHWF